jgi:16S rRNA (guanine966-N2)-methyltransferase
MRIISGSLKGKKLLEPKDKNTRPLKDLVKESIFNIIKHSNLIEFSIENSLVLDLFSGIGSFGIECLSRGSRAVVFFENYPNVVDVLKKNLINLKIQYKASINEKNIFIDNAFDHLEEKFDLIFIDPPYKKKKLSELLEYIFRSNLLKKNGILIIHRHKKEKDDFPKSFKILREEIYGISKIIFGKSS